MPFDFEKLYTFWKLRGIIKDFYETLEPTVYKIILVPIAHGKTITIYFEEKNGKYYMQSVYVYLNKTLILVDSEAINYVNQI